MQRKIITIAFFLLLAIQLIPINKSNPEASNPLVLPSEVEAIIKPACFDCHSNHTRWPWYTKIAPVSWILADHVKEGRRELNFSEWESYSLKRQLRKLSEIKEEISQGKMPLKDYQLMHPEAMLPDSAKQMVYRWADDYHLTLLAKNDTVQ